MLFPELFASGVLSAITTIIMTRLWIKYKISENRKTREHKRAMKTLDIKSKSLKINPTNVNSLVSGLDVDSLYDLADQFGVEIPENLDINSILPFIPQLLKNFVKKNPDEDKTEKYLNP